jgi:predicted DNA binding protein
MRKLTLEFELNEMAREGLKPIFDYVHSYEILEMLKIDYEEGICVDLVEFHLKEGLANDDLKYIGKMEILSILKSEGNKHTCLVKYQETGESKDLFKESDWDLISTTPNIITEDKVICSYIGDNENLNRFVEFVKAHAGNIVNMSFTKAVYQKQDIISVLTDKQKYILIAANQHGYYDYPRKINSEQLSEKVGISKATLVQHLRKAEGRLMANIFAGYLSK